MTNHKKSEISPITKLRKNRHHTKTIIMICRFIREKTGCNHCGKGSFCTKPTHTGTWRYGCIAYKPIADHLNAEGHRTVRGKKWTSEQVKREVKKLARPPEEETYTESIAPPKIIWDQQILEYAEGDAYIDVLNEQATVIKPTSLDSESDIDYFLTELRRFLVDSNDPNNKIVVAVIQNQKKDY